MDDSQSRMPYLENCEITSSLWFVIFISVINLNGNLVQLAGANPTAATSTATPTGTPQAAVTSHSATSVAAALPQAMGVSGGNIVMVSQDRCVTLF
jgi:hypothetical protein